MTNENEIDFENEEFRLKKDLSMPDTQCNTFIALSDRIGATAKGIYLSILAHIQHAEHYGYEFDLDNEHCIWGCEYHKITKNQFHEALLVLAQEGLLGRDENGEWWINTWNNEREKQEMYKLSLFKKNRGRSK